jgi:hypothetical protein
VVVARGVALKMASNLLSRCHLLISGCPLCELCSCSVTDLEIHDPISKIQGRVSWSFSANLSFDCHYIIRYGTHNCLPRPPTPLPVVHLVSNSPGHIPFPSPNLQTSHISRLAVIQTQRHKMATQQDLQELLRLITVTRKTPMLQAMTQIKSLQAADLRR